MSIVIHTGKWMRNEERELYTQTLIGHYFRNSAFINHFDNRGLFNFQTNVMFLFV